MAKASTMIVWWKIENLLLSYSQLKETGLYPAGQLKLWLGKP